MNLKNNLETETENRNLTICYRVGNKLYLNITNKCSCNCVFCIRKNSDGVYGSGSLWLSHEPTLEEVFKSLDTVDLDEYTEVVFCGYGEPLERFDDVVKIAEYIKAKSNIFIRVNTNGLSEKILPEKIINSVSVSLNASNKEEYFEITGSRDFDLMLNFAKKCKEKGIKTFFTVVDMFTDDLSACRKLADDLGIKLRVRQYE
ncbi:MAG: TatD family nuclease-associated radical SAM protein [Ruminococcus sp.]|nr:TatD family nuclease-associated radical SAM protein [Ruminococcus sp.]